MIMGTRTIARKKNHDTAHSPNDDSTQMDVGTRSSQQYTQDNKKKEKYTNKFRKIAMDTEACETQVAFLVQRNLSLVEDYRESPIYNALKNA